MENNILTLLIKPLDTLFFKDGKPFSMGDDSWADGIFPPAPSVIYGAIRTWILANSDSVNIENVIAETEDLVLLDLYYSINGANVLPLPYDYGTRKDKDQQENYTEKTENIITVERFSLKIKPELTSESNKVLVYNENDYILEQPKNAFISVDDFILYLQNDKKSIAKITVNTINNTIEPKIGIKRTNETLSSDDGNLYRVGMNRFTNLKFIVRADSKYLTSEFDRFLKFGGEGKIVIVDEFLNTKTGAKKLKIETGITTKNILVYLATPAIFHNEYPDISKFFSITATLVACSVGKTVNIGGFDMKENCPKTMYKAVPAGSVYFYELDKEIQIDNFQGIKISDELSKQGFGIAYFGTFNFR